MIRRAEYLTMLQSLAIHGASRVAIAGLPTAMIGETWQILGHKPSTNVWLLGTDIAVAWHLLSCDGFGA
jgi:hypothetical protein